MGTGWRRALCTSVQRDDGGDGHRDAKNKKRRPQDTPTAGAGGGFFSAVKSAATGGGSSSSSNPSTPTLRCRTKPLQQPAEPASVTPPSAPAPMGKHRMPLLQALSAPASPRSPSRFALLKASLLPSKEMGVLNIRINQRLLHCRHCHRRRHPPLPPADTHCFLLDRIIHQMRFKCNFCNSGYIPYSKFLVHLYVRHYSRPSQVRLCQGRVHPRHKCPCVF